MSKAEETTQQFKLNNMGTNKAEEIREDIIDRTYHNINNEPDKSAIHIRIALNNYAVPFEKKIDELTKEVEAQKHTLENDVIYIKKLQKEFERLRKERDMLCDNLETLENKIKLGVR